jgi:hypothetical protein
VLSVGLPVLADKPTFALSLGFEDCVVLVLMAGFVVGDFHCAG